MKLKNSLVVAAALSAGLVFAQEEAAEEADQSAEGKAAASAAPAKTAPAQSFTTLPFCRGTSGDARVLKPGSGDWQTVEDGRFYPLGSFFKTGRDSTLAIGFGKDCVVKLEPDSSFGTQAQALREPTRRIVLQRGTVLVELPENLAAGAFTIEASGFTVKNPAGNSKYVMTEKGDGYLATVRCVTGSMAVEGRHFDIPQMRAANEFDMRATADNLETIIYGKSGDYLVKLDQGIATSIEIGDDGSQVAKTNPRTLEWKLSPETRVRINRSVPSIGEKMAVHTMAFDAAGALQSECSFCEGRAEINSGEIIKKEGADEEAAAQKAAEATEEAAAETTEETAAEDASEE